MTCKKLVSEFESLNKTAADVQYKKCKILFTIKDQYLYQELGYISFQEFVENELSITRATANRYCKFYSLVYWHEYSKNDAVRLITVLGVSSAVTAMESNNRGASVTHAIASSKSYNRYQMPLTITDSDMQMIEDTLERFGAQHYESGRVMNRGDALIAICKIARELPAAERRKRIKVAS